MIDPLAEYRLNLSPYSYVRDNPLRFIDLFGLIDTIKLPDVEVVAQRTPSEQSSLSWLWILSNRIDYFLAGTSYEPKIRDASKFENWCIRHINMQSLAEISDMSATAGFGNGADPALRNYVRTNASYEGITEDRKIQEDRAGNNIEIIQSNPLVKKYNEDTARSNENDDTTLTIRSEKQGVFNKYRWLDYKDTVIKKYDVQKVEKLNEERVENFKNGY